jgi:hypothetical protein
MPTRLRMDWLLALKLVDCTVFYACTDTLPPSTTCPVAPQLSLVPAVPSPQTPVQVPASDHGV